MNDRPAVEPVTILLMNEHGVDERPWDDEGLSDGEELGLSDGLRHDLAAYCIRWDEAVPASVWDDRRDGVPVMQAVTSWRHSLRERRPRARRAARAEDAAMLRIGEDLTARVQAELGPGHRVVLAP